MLDPNKLIEMLTNLASMSQTTQQSLTQNFMSGAAGMKMDGGVEMEKMMSMMSSMNEQASSGMSDMMKNMQQNMDMQASAGKSEATGAAKAGFPQEAMDFFNAMQKK
jgi:hypothetical protein